MLLTNEIRVAGCSMVALLMMSIPGITNHPFDVTPPSQTETPTFIPAAATLAPAATPRKRFSFLRRPSMSGIASWYGAVLNGHKTASGETFDMNQMTACHRTLPFGTMVRVVDTHSGKSVIVRINDRGVLFADRVIDLSRGAAEKLGIRSLGTAPVRLEVLTRKQAAAEVAEARVSDSIQNAATAEAQ
ncbi:septal ring lytic transglycosylase RlpA family protein [Granulicella arctica]|uniref:septal ring lytic transglycosylase RlpA family protein n=1 Tax=Granulicella arctica TaxID=940613 RepID=UPI0021DFE894|nr:septal ring lytic transglycosylase RlpA family protein [Granulicella arctica]